MDRRSHLISSTDTSPDLARYFWLMPSVPPNQSHWYDIFLLQLLCCINLCHDPWTSQKSSLHCFPVSCTILRHHQQKPLPHLQNYKHNGFCPNTLPNALSYEPTTARILHTFQNPSVNNRLNQRSNLLWFNLLFTHTYLIIIIIVIVIYTTCINSMHTARRDSVQNFASPHKYHFDMYT